MPPAGDPERQLLGHAARSSTIPRPARPNGTGRVPFAFANCGLTSTDRPPVRRLQFHPGEPHQPGVEEHPALPAAAAVARQRQQLFRDSGLRIGLPQDRLEGDVEREQPAEPERPVSYLPANELAGGSVRRPGAGRIRWRSARCSIRMSAARRCRRRDIMSRDTSCIDGLFGFTRQHTYQQPPGDPEVLGRGGRHRQRVSAAAAARLRDAPHRHRTAGAPTGTASASMTTPARCSTTSIRSGSGW